MAITEKEFELVEKRFEAWNEKIKVAKMNGIELTKDEMLEHVKAKDEIGRDLTEVQIHYLKKLKERKR